MSLFPLSRVAPRYIFLFYLYLPTLLQISISLCRRKIHQLPCRPLHAARFRKMTS
jgi:hypothetical protein